jgi:RNA recognition motif-containing protein
VLGSPSFLTPPKITAPAPVSHESIRGALPSKVAEHASLEARAHTVVADVATHAAAPGRLSERRQPARPRRISAEAAASRTVAMSGETRTTVMMRNLPNDYTRQMMLDLLDSRGFAGHYDFFYLPMDFTTGSNIGYAFINFSCPSSATAFWQAFDGFSRWSLRSRKVCTLCWSDPCQGLDANVKRYQNSPVMCDTVPEEFKPMIFSSAGKQMRFPSPTRALRAPRMARALA